MLHFLFLTVPGAYLVGAALGYGFRGLVRREASYVLAQVLKLKGKL